MSTHGRRFFLKGAIAATIPLVGLGSGKSESASPRRKSGVGSSNARTIWVELKGDLRNKSVGRTSIKYGVLSDPVEVAGNGTYRVRVTPRPVPEHARAIMDCPDCGRSGQLLDFILTDADGRQLARTGMGTSPEGDVGMHIFGRQGVMVQIWSSPS